jgi:arginyl-tRNA synthetase
MPDLLSALAPRFEAASVAAFGQVIDPVLRPSDQAGVDVQANGAMAAAKQLGMPPRDIAAKLADALDLAGVASAVEVAGPGFINVTLTNEFIASLLADDERLGVATVAAPETVVVDYSSPTVTKEMHVGHLRTTIIGDALVRMLEFLGHTVIRQNHYGDWGTSFGMLIEHLDETGAPLDDLNEFYKEAYARFESEPEFSERARARVVALQSGDVPTQAMWREFVGAAHRHNVEVYELLGVKLVDDDLRPESAYNDVLAEVCDDLESRGVAVVDDGALCVFVDGFDAPLIIRKSDGGYTYGATDLAAVRYRVTELGATWLLYVVDSRQSQHLTQVFRAAEKAGWLQPPTSRADHVMFGTVLGPGGRPLKSRSGDTPRLNVLIEEAVARAESVVAEKNPELDEAMRAAVARQVGIGAVKYSDLASDRVKDYVFDYDRMLSFDGNTAPYLQYAHARIQSIFRRGDFKFGTVGEVKIVEPQEKALALALLGFEPAVRAAAEHLAPHRLATYLFELAQAFTAFFESCPVLRAPDDATRDSRLTLASLTARTLAVGLSLLGIEAPDQM